MRETEPLELNKLSIFRAFTMKIDAKTKKARGKCFHEKILKY